MYIAKAAHRGRAQFGDPANGRANTENIDTTGREQRLLDEWETNIGKLALGNDDTHALSPLT